MLEVDYRFYHYCDETFIKYVVPRVKKAIEDKDFEAFKKIHDVWSIMETNMNERRLEIRRMGEIFKEEKLTNTNWFYFTYLPDFAFVYSTEDPEQVITTNILDEDNFNAITRYSCECG